MEPWKLVPRGRSTKEHYPGISVVPGGHQESVSLCFDLREYDTSETIPRARQSRVENSPYKHTHNYMCLIGLAHQSTGKRI
jgi:hypothetical protein